MPLKIVRNDITKMNTEAIVNTANEQPAVGQGCDSAIYEAAGYDELLSYRKEHIGAVPEGEAFITPGFRLKAKYIIHAVSPLYMGGDHGEEQKLRSCYRESLRIAKENGISSISFPLISTGGFGYPMEDGLRIAADEINAFLLKNDMLIYLVVFGTKATALGEKLYPQLEAYIDHNYVKEKREEEYGDAYFGSVRPSDTGYEEYGMQARHFDRRTGRNNKALAPSVKDADFMASAPIAPHAGFMGAPAPSETPASYDDFIEERDSKLEERMKHISDTFSEYLMYLIHDKNMENVDVYKHALVDKKVFAKIKNNPNYHPKKITALCLCVGARLNIDETKDLLARAGYALSPCDKTDIIFSFFIENGIYDMIDIDIALEEHGLQCIVS
ncbi:MAG: macro domain-containing protein [Eubacteriales bacterium]|nr:macro domain-containing protein [Eubacteriales bacterium]